MPPINCFPTNRPQCRSTILLGRMLLTLYDCVGILKSTDDLGEQLFFSDVRGFSMSHIAGVSVQGAHTDFDWHGRFGLCHKFSSLLFSVPGFPIVFYNDWGWHEWLIIFTKALIQQGIKKRCCSITTQLHFDGFCQLPPRPQQMCFIWLFTTSSCVFRTTFYRDNNEIDHQAETEASSPSRIFFWKSPPLWAKKCCPRWVPKRCPAWCHLYHHTFYHFWFQIPKSHANRNLLSEMSRRGALTVGFVPVKSSALFGFRSHNLCYVWSRTCCPGRVPTWDSNWCHVHRHTFCGKTTNKSFLWRPWIKTSRNHQAVWYRIGKLRGIFSRCM